MVEQKKTNINPQTQEAEQVISRVNIKKITPSHFVIKMLTTKLKKNLKRIQKKKDVLYTYKIKLTSHRKQ